MPRARRAPAVAAGAKLLVVLLGFAWGFTWVAGGVALKEITPWSLRFAGLTIGTVTLFSAAFLGGRNLRIPPGGLKHVALAGFFNVTAFNMLSAFAQMTTATSRVVIINYSMPIWSAALAWLVLGDRLNRIVILALALCITGLTILIWPLVADGAPIGIFYALGCAVSWTIATVYMKWADIAINPLANAAWQLLLGWLVISAGMLAFEGLPHLWPLQMPTLIAIVYIGIFGVGLAHFLWWAIVEKLPTVTASLGSLLVPVVGVVGSALILGERPTITDIIGFVSIFAAAACVLLQPSARQTVMPE